MKTKEIIKELELNYGYKFNPKEKHEFDWLCNLIKDVGTVVSKNESLHLVSSSLLNKRIDKWIEENDKNAGMCDGISSVIFTSYSQAYWNVKQFIEVNES